MTEKEFNQVFADNLNFYMEKTNTSRADLANVLDVSLTSVANWCNAVKTPRMDKVDRMCQHFGITRNDLMNEKVTEGEDPHKGMIPLYGMIPAGPEHWTNDDPEDWIRYEPDDPGQYFALRVHGDSMAPTLMDGDLVFVLSDAEIHTGDIAVVRINGTEKTMKEVQVMDNGIMLVGHNTNAYTPHFYSAEEVKSLPIVFEGKVVALKREF